MTIAQRLRDLRKSHALSQERLAHLMSVNDWLILQHEQGKISPNLYTLQKYANAYRLRLSELLEGVEVR